MSEPIEVTKTGMRGINLNEALDVSILKIFKKDDNKNDKYLLWFEKEYDYYTTEDAVSSFIIACDKNSSTVKGVFYIAGSDDLFKDHYLIEKLGMDYSVLESSANGNSVRTSLGWLNGNIMIKKTCDVYSGKFKLEYQLNEQYMPGITLSL